MPIPETLGPCDVFVRLGFVAGNLVPHILQAMVCRAEREKFISGTEVKEPILAPVRAPQVGRGGAGESGKWRSTNGQERPADGGSKL